MLNLIRLPAFEKLLVLIKGCKKEDCQSQKQLYSHYYGYGMSIAQRYSKDKEDAIEILNDSFLKIFNGGIQKYDEFENCHEGFFKNWIKRIIINTAVDYYRKNHKHYYHQNVEDVNIINDQIFIIEATISNTLSYEELLKLVKKLSPVYYTVFSMYVIDGYTHKEIAQKLNISIGTSKSNLAKARLRLKEMTKKENKELITIEHKDEYAKYTG
jgi:RNA polymerase sigma factor (sigma-70 family)